VAEVGDHGAAHLDVGQRAHRDHPVQLDLRHGRGGQLPHAGVRSDPRLRLARQHQQVLGVAPHPGREVLQLEEPVAVLGIAVPLLQPVEHGELPADQVLPAAGEAREDVVHAAAQQGLLPGEPHGRGVDGVEGARDLADLLVGVHPDRLDAHVGDPAVDGRHPGDRRGQPGAGDLERRAPQRAQRHQQRPGDDDHHRHREQHQERDQHAVAHRPGPRARRERGPVGRQLLLSGDLDVADQRGRAARGAVPLARLGGGQRLAPRHRGEHPLLDALPGVHLGARDRGGPPLPQRRRRRRAQVGERGGPGGLQQRGRRATDQHGGHGGVLAAHLLLRGGHGHRVVRRPQQGGGRGGERGALQRQEHLDDAVYAESTRSVGNAEPVTARRSAARSASRSRAAASRSAAAGPNWADGRAAPPPRPRRPARPGRRAGRGPRCARPRRRSRRTAARLAGRRRAGRPAGPR
jgi:hypothetical protein